MSITEEDLVTSLLQQMFGVSQLQRKVWFAASEIDAALEIPIRID